MSNPKFGDLIGDGPPNRLWAMFVLDTSVFFMKNESEHQSLQMYHTIHLPAWPISEEWIDDEAPQET